MYVNLQAQEEIIWIKLYLFDSHCVHLWICSAEILLYMHTFSFSGVLWRPELGTAIGQLWSAPDVMRPVSSDNRVWFPLLPPSVSVCWTQRQEAPVCQMATARFARTCRVFLQYKQQGAARQQLAGAAAQTQHAADHTAAGRFTALRVRLSDQTSGWNGNSEAQITTTTLPGYITSDLHNLTLSKPFCKVYTFHFCAVNQRFVFKRDVLLWSRHSK